jgi:alanine racemase
MRVHANWVEVSRAALRHNFQVIQSHVAQGVAVCPVIKSDGYGHGAAGCALALREAGAKWLAVSTADEGVALRHKGIQEQILVLSGFWPGEEEAIGRYELTPAVWERRHIELLDKLVGNTGGRCRVPIHLKINTGMNRLGADTRELEDLFEAIRLAPHVFFEGIFSHFASSEVVDLPYADEQLQQFKKAVAQAEGMGLTPPIRHMANSAAIASRPQSWFNLVRPGLAIYGYCLPLTATVPDWPVPQALPLKPALEWRTRILQVREVAAGEPVGYSSGHITQSPTRVAILPVGYGDGLYRRLSARGRVIVRDSYAAILGNVSMNLTAVDVTGIPGAQVGDEVTLLGRTSSCQITAWDHANLAGTIPYEILCNISGRLPRTFVE